MNRFAAGLAACLLAAAALPSVHAQTPAELTQTSRYIAAFQNPDGGFAAKPGGPSTLPATSSAIRILKNTGGSIPDVLACIKFVKSCVDRATGGFVATPGGKPDISTTATGLMAYNELKITDEATVTGALKYLAENAKSFEEVRIAVAGYEAVNKTSPVFERWTAEILKGVNTDGTFGSGATQARETGGKAVALLRMGVTLDKNDAIASFLKSAQRDDGGWGQKEGTSELETTYRIMRFFFMAKHQPDIERLTAFVARCRHSDGGYGIQPGAEATPGGTYFATIVLRWVRLLSGEPALTETAGFVPLFNGKDLTGWDGDLSLWSARDGMLVGTSKGLKNNEFLATTGSWGNFVLKLTFRMKGSESSNSGVQFRSVRIPGHEMSGYQADIGQGFWGCLYDESRRNKVMAQASDAALKSIRKNGWNQYVIDAKGDRIRLALNGPNSVNYLEEEKSVARDGRIAVQLHAGGPLTMEFKNIYIQPLPDPKEDDSTSAGFHLKTMRSGQDSRKYTVYIPRGYDGRKAFPVVLFLHGAGERGTDGVVPSQVGLGPAVLNNPDAFPAVAVFPQAKTTWRADSDDAKAALDALDEVLETYKTDRSRVVITGLSMGGAGSWSIAAAHPERFAAVVPVCGRGDTSKASPLAKLPVWTFCGDADQTPTVLNGRAMTEAINSAGGNARLTEYRDVPHNSWDRAYGDPALISWMLSQSRK
jgi:pimeloyl-ACP methyl ester carboxylesterase